MISNAVSQNRVSRVVGYQLTKGNFNTTSPNLPQVIALLGEANTANQTGLSTAPVQITTAQQAGQLYGYGSPLHLAARILFPQSGGGTNVPVYVYPQIAAGGGAANVQTITVTGTATANGTHYVNVAGRENVDGSFYAVNIVSGDTPTIIAGKIRDSINAVLGAPVIATAAIGVVTLTAKWVGLTSQDLQYFVDANNTSLGVTYAVAQTTAGSGTPDITASLAMFGSQWNTIVINTYGTVSAVLTSLETFNGIPDPVNPTGRYTGIIMKPFIALTGSTADDPTSITSTRPTQVTIAICPAPKSLGMPFEAAANMAVLYSNTAQNTPHLDVSGQTYPDMPIPAAGSVIAMSDYNTRDAFVQKGCSTVTINAGVYKVMDFVTTYGPAGEVPPQFRYCRNLNVDFNIKYGYHILEEANVVDHAIANDGDVVTATNVIKPKQWRQILGGYADDLASRALIADAGFMQGSVTVGISTTNPDRLETFFRYKRTGIARIVSTTAQAGFNFGTN
jgi:phage tail sheath gpL-like